MDSRTQREGEAAIASFEEIKHYDRVSDLLKYIEALQSERDELRSRVEELESEL